MSQSWFVALRYAFGGRRNSAGRVISLLSVIGLTLGSGLLIAVMSIMNGFDRELRERILVLVPHVRFYNGSPIQNWTDVVGALERQPGVASVTPYREDQALVRFGGKTTAMTLFAIDPATELDRGILSSRLGDSVFQELQNQTGIYLGAGLAQRLGVAEGDSISLFFNSRQGSLPRPAQVAVLGLLHTSTELDHRLGITSLANLSELLEETVEPMGISMHVEDPFNARQTALESLGILPADYRAITWASSHGNLYEAIQTSRTMVGLIVFLILAIAAFNVLASLLIASADRQADIAVLKTLGADRGFLMRVFTFQGLCIGFLGAVMGVLLGLLICSQLDSLVAIIEWFRGSPLLQSQVYPLDYLPVEIQPAQLLSVALVAIVLSTLASLYPAWRLQSIRPAETLRYE